MKYEVYAVFDAKVKAFAMPFFAPARGSAMRSFHQEVNNQQSMLAKYPEDFTLYQIGEYEDVTGVLSALPQHVNCGLASTFKGG